MRIRGAEKGYFAAVYALVTLAVFVTLYPFLYVISMSISSPEAVAAKLVVLWPVGFSTLAYERVFQNRQIWNAFYNSAWYTVVATAGNLLFTTLGAYPLARPHFFARKFFTGVFVFTMFFWGGLVPFFVIVRNLGLYNTRWALVVPYLIETWNLVICRTFFQGIPEELYESARIDGAGEVRVLSRITLPLSKQILAVLALFYGISNWNGWFAAVMFLSDTSMHPIQVYLRNVLIAGNSAEAMMSWAQMGRSALLSTLQLKYALIIVASVPIILVYPFVQRYFEKGVMLGSLKG
jgi:putative aldouronate transport system permease protein